MSYQQSQRLDGERAVVTGGGRAIGLACVEVLAESGASVVVIERIEAELALALRKKGYDVSLKTGDVTDAARMDVIADELAADNKAATILVNNAGIGMTGVSSETISNVDWLRILDVNVNGVLWCTKAFGRHMMAMKRWAIVQSRVNVRLHRQPAGFPCCLQRIQSSGASHDEMCGR